MFGLMEGWVGGGGVFADGVGGGEDVGEDGGVFVVAGEGPAAVYTMCAVHELSIVHDLHCVKGCGTYCSELTIRRPSTVKSDSHCS